MDPLAEPAEPISTEDLSRTYQQVVRESTWEIDGVEIPAAEAEPIEEQQATPLDPKRIVEAMLFVGGSPLTSARACEIIRGFAPEQFAQAIDTLNHDYRRQGRPYTIQALDEGYLLTLRPRFRDVIEKVYGGPREARLSTAVIDTLALVAYRQPAGKAEIDAMRGADSGSLLRQLVRRGLIQVEYGETANGKGKGDVTYVTTPRFLQLFGLSSLDDLPQTQDLQQM